MPNSHGNHLRAAVTAPSRRAIVMAVVVAALGYFVDIYDLVLFSVLRVASLTALGLSGEDLTNVGVRLINAQMYGMLIGGVLWGMLGDRRGRISVLFGSITLYSIANIANGFVADVPEASAWRGVMEGIGLAGGIDQYVALRFLAGVGLAGELGAGITLVAELLRGHARGYGTTIVATFGICGALLAVAVAKLTDWRVSYFVGGGMGLALLALRIGVVESGIFTKVREEGRGLGNPLMLLWPAERLVRYLAIVVAAIPIWFIVAVPVTFAPELARELGVTEPVSAGTAVAWCYAGLAVGDLSSGLLSQRLRSRRRSLAVFQSITAAAFIASYFIIRAEPTPLAYYACSGAMGLGIGYWAVFVTVGAEQFGTNLRATAATSAPNFVRGSVPVVTTAWLALKSWGLGPVEAAAAVGITTMVCAAVALAFLRETYGRDLDFTEEL